MAHRRSLHGTPDRRLHSESVIFDVQVKFAAGLPEHLPTNMRDPSTPRYKAVDLREMYEGCAQDDGFVAGIEVQTVTP